MTRVYLRGIGGAVVGAVVGILLYALLLRRGFIVPLLPPGLLGLGAGLAQERRCWGMGGVAAGLGLIAMVLSDGLLRQPPMEQPGFWYFLTHLHQAAPMRMLGMDVPLLAIYLIGVLAAFYFGMGRNYLHRSSAGGD